MDTRVLKNGGIGKRPNQMKPSQKRSQVSEIRIRLKMYEIIQNLARRPDIDIVWFSILASVSGLLRSIVDVLDKVAFYLGHSKFVMSFRIFCAKFP